MASADPPPALVCAECKHVLVLASHLTEPPVGQGDGQGPARTVQVLGEDRQLYTVYFDDHENSLELIVAKCEQEELPSGDGWVENPEAVGQGLSLDPKDKGTSTRSEDLQRAWFRGHTRKAARCEECLAGPVAYLLEPDLAFSISTIAEQALGATMGMIAFWGVDASKVIVRGADGAEEQLVARKDGKLTGATDTSEMDDMIRQFVESQGGVLFETFANEGEPDAMQSLMGGRNVMAPGPRAGGGAVQAGSASDDNDSAGSDDSTGED
mmetsp:Transcript_12097/g.35785  ORF Transcript_12097/g.35785 Transcript_12097/m.35785 type:complete len:268 (+) Transcript_12097:23-826(+)